MGQLGKLLEFIIKVLISPEVFQAQTAGFLNHFLTICIYSSIRYCCRCRLKPLSPSLKLDQIILKFKHILCSYRDHSITKVDLSSADYMLFHSTGTETSTRSLSLKSVTNLSKLTSVWRLMGTSQFSFWCPVGRGILNNPFCSSFKWSWEVSSPSVLMQTQNWSLYIPSLCIYVQYLQRWINHGILWSPWFFYVRECMGH